MRALMAAAVIFSSVVPQKLAAGTFFSGNDLFQYCASNRSFISGFVAGAFDKTEIDYNAFLGLFFDMLDPDPSKVKTGEKSLTIWSPVIKGYCSPAQINVQQVSDIFCHYMTTNPATRHTGAAYLLNQSLIQAWPCPAAK